jgi:hypothetical protein
MSIYWEISCLCLRYRFKCAGVSAKTAADIDMHMHARKAINRSAAGSDVRAGRANAFVESD